jgi:predicted PurR-regulated permease PerM
MNAFLLLIAFGLVLLILILYTYIKEQETSRKILQIAKSLDSLKRDFFRYKREVDNNNENFQNQQMDENLIFESVARKIEIFVEEQKNIFLDQTYSKNGNINSAGIEQLSNNLDNLRFEFEQFRENAQVRIYSLESAVKDTILERSFGSVDKTQQIIALAEQGFSHDQIQQKLRVSQREIDFVLKIANYGD